MASGKTKKRIQGEIAELQIAKRNGMMRAILAFVVMFVIVVIKVMADAQGAEWSTSTIVNAVIFMSALVAAGVAGMGMRAWQISRRKISELERRL